MTFKEVLAQVVEWLQQDGRVSHRALQRQFDIDDAYLKDVKEALLYTHAARLHDDGQGLVWTREPTAALPNAHHETDSETRFHATLPAVIAFLQREGRVTYRTLMHAYGLNDRLLAEICNELRLRRLAIDEEGKVLTWTGETQPTSSPIVTPTSEAASQNASSEASLTEIAPDQHIVVSEPVRHVSEAERRQLTVMFCDLVGSTDLSGKLDPEDLREVVRAYQESAAEVVERYEGHIAQYLGDGLLIYFGFPLAHEDDAQRAVYTGLGIPEAITTLNAGLEADYGVQLSVRIGIHTGPVVVGEMGGGGRYENLALGETPNIAARLEGLARPNTTVISPVTAQLVHRSFLLEELGPHDLKGVAEPMQLFAVVGSREVEPDDHEAMLSGGFDTLVGRDEEIGLLLRRWEQSKEGQGQVVLISGDAGLGKSSLVEGLRAHVRQEGYTRITFRCSPYATNSAMHPVIEHVQRALGWRREDMAETKLGKLEQALKSTNLPAEETVPLFAALLSLPVPEGRYPVLTLSPQRLRQQTQDTLVAWMLEEAERQPVLAVWEDVHWADPSTLELLGLFIEQTPTVPMLNVLAFRPEFVPPWPPQSHLTPITLNRLERSHVEAFVRRLAGHKTLPSEVEMHIVAKTDGVPLYVQELTKMLLESELLEEGAEQYILTGSLSSASIPATLQDSLMARLDRLPAVREVAQLGAVLGREFDYEMIQSLAVVDDLMLQAGLSQLVTHELLYQRGRIPRARYIFRHVLIRDAAYESLLRRTRQQYHRQVAEVLDAGFPDVVETQPEWVAHHYTEAGLLEPAIGYWQRAGQRASERSAHPEAISHFTTGLSLLQTLPETLERHQQELPLQTGLGAASLMIKGHVAPEVEAAYTRARALCQHLGNTQDVFPVLFGLWRFYMVRPDFLLSWQLGQELLTLAEQRDEAPLDVVAHYTLGFTALCQGELRAVQYHLETVMARYHPSQRRVPLYWAGQDPGVGCYMFGAFAQWLQGYPDQALARVQEGLKLATEIDHSFTAAFAHITSAFIHKFRQEHQAVYDHMDVAMTLATEQGFPYWVSLSTFFQGWSIVSLGNREDGVQQMHRGLTDWRAPGGDLFIPYGLALLAAGCGSLNQIDAAFATLNEGLDIMNRTGEHWSKAELYRIKGELLLQQATPDTVQAEVCFHQALDVARQQAAKSLELRTATSLAKLWQQQDKSQDAYDLLAPVYGWFTEGFDTADLQEAQALLNELEG